MDSKDEKAPKVYITQIPHRRDNETGAFVPAFNIGPALEHGTPVVMLPPRAAFHDTKELVKQMVDGLRDYDYDAGDSLLPLGDPAVMAVAAAVLGKQFGKFIVLKWDRNIGRYLPTHINI